MSDRHHLKQLQALLEVSHSLQLVTAMASVSGFTNKQLRYISAPLVLPNGSWADTLPDWVRLAIYKDRLELVWHEKEQDVAGKLATEVEVMAYLNILSLEFPLSTEITRVYLWSACRSMHKHQKAKSETEAWDMAGIEPIQLSESERTEHLEKLQAEIRETAIKAAKWH